MVIVRDMVFALCYRVSCSNTRLRGGHAKQGLPANRLLGPGKPIVMFYLEMSTSLI